MLGLHAQFFVCYIQSVLHPRPEDPTLTQIRTRKPRVAKIDLSCFDDSNKRTDRLKRCSTLRVASLLCRVNIKL